MGFVYQRVDCVGVCRGFFYFIKQKTAYEMRISDWSSDVCSSDLQTEKHRQRDIAAGTQQQAFAQQAQRLQAEARKRREAAAEAYHQQQPGLVRPATAGELFFPAGQQIGRASCRERVCQYV